MVKCNVFVVTESLRKSPSLVHILKNRQHLDKFGAMSKVGAKIKIVIDRVGVNSAGMILIQFVR